MPSHNTETFSQKQAYRLFEDFKRNTK